MKVNQIITEGISDIVYHWTGGDVAAEIIKTDQFILTPTFKNDAEELVDNKKKSYFMSTTRSRLGDYHLHSPDGVLFTLDGRALGQTYKGGPVDYYGSSRDRAKSEMEDRVLSNTRTIPAIKYIKEIAIKGIEIDKVTAWDKLSFDVYSWAKKNNIPVYAYTHANRQAFATNNKAKAIPHAVMLKVGKEAKKTFRADTMGIGGTRRARRKRVYSVAQLIELATKMDLSKLSKEAKDIAHTMSVNVVAAMRSFSADISNNSQTKAVEKVSQLMRQFKTPTLREFVVKLGEFYSIEIKAETLQAHRKKAAEQYDKNKDFHNHINAVANDEVKFDKEKYGEYSSFMIEDAIEVLALLGILKNKDMADDQFRINQRRMRAKFEM